MIAVSKGQIITNSIIPSIGTSLSTVNDTMQVNPGASGSGVTWDFSNLPDSMPTTTTNYVDPAGTTFVADFPGATLATNTGTTAYSYLKANATSFEVLGSETPDMKLTYSNPETYLQFPFAMGNTFSDSSVYEFDVPAQGLTGNSHNLVTVTADGSGTLKTPSGTYTNVLRVKIQRNSVGTSLYAGFTIPTTETSEIYSWLHPFYQMELLSISTTVSTIDFMGNVTTQTGYSSGFTTTVPSGINDFNLIDGFSVYPNPATNNLKIALETPEAGALNITIFNTMGQVVYQYENAQKNTYPLMHDIDISALKNGTYHTRITNGNKVLSRNFIVSH